jgi:hypothetical protein
LDTPITEVKKLLDDVCNTAVISLFPPSTADCEAAVFNTTALQQVGSACLGDTTKVGNGSDSLGVYQNLASWCSPSCISKTKSYTKDVVDYCAKDTLTVLGAPTAANELEQTLENLKSVVCLKKGDEYCVDNYVQFLITSLMKVISDVVGANLLLPRQIPLMFVMTA